MLQAHEEMNARITKLDNNILNFLEAQKIAEGNQKIVDEKINEFANELFKVEEDNTKFKGRIKALEDDNDVLQSQVKEQNRKISLHREKTQIAEENLKTNQKALEEITEQITEIQQKLEKL
ncbi:hypothetical protein [Candidatus Protochlamydia sp. R18]|uniref:hypothetical protein n=1 Tax=Candidatus Protochlamydia sp. R18 TaxID=1353977 RepID=UPI0011DDA636|nr:hypothetical protein [Candidatus Protochlamydia sp. R18]